MGPVRWEPRQSITTVGLYLIPVISKDVRMLIMCLKEDAWLKDLQGDAFRVTKMDFFTFNEKAKIKDTISFSIDLLVVYQNSQLQKLFVVVAIGILHAKNLIGFRRLTNVEIYS